MQNNIVEKNSNNFEELLNKAYDAIKKSNLYKAEKYMEKLKKDNISNLSLDLLKVRILMENSSYEEAISLINNIIKEDDKDYRPYLCRGKIYMSIGEKKLGYDDFRNAYFLTNNNTIVRYNLARAAMSCKKYIEARNIINDLFHNYKDRYLMSIYDSCNRYIIDDLFNKYDSLNIRQKIDLAKSYKYIGNINKSLEILSSINNIEDEPEALLLFANYLRIDKRYDDALTYIDKYLALNNDEVCEAYYIRGLILENREEYSKSLEYYSKCINEDKNYRPVYNRMTKVLLSFNYYNRAFEACEKAIELNYDKDISLNNKGMIYFYLTNYDEALQCFEQSIDEFPEFIDGYLNKSMILRKKGEYREALSMCNNLIEEGNEDNDILREKSLVLINMGRYDRAVKWINKSISIYKNSIYSLYIKSLCLCKMKDYSNALNVIDYTLNNYKNNDIILVALKVYVYISMNKCRNSLEVIREYFNDSEMEDKNLIINFIGKVKYSSSLLKRDFTYEEVISYLKKIINGIN